MLGIETVGTTAYHPQTNGQVELYNPTMATQMRHYVADDPSRWDELLPVITMAFNSQPHRSTGIAPFELAIPRRIPDHRVRNLPPGTPLATKGKPNDGSPLACKREFMASLRKQLPVVVESLRKTQERYNGILTTGSQPAMRTSRSPTTYTRPTTIGKTSCKPRPLDTSWSLTWLRMPPRLSWTLTGRKNAPVVTMLPQLLVQRRRIL